jgi:hypothetical protein
VIFLGIGLTDIESQHGFIAWGRDQKHERSHSRLTSVASEHLRELHKKHELLAAALVPSGTLRVARSRRVRYPIVSVKISTDHFQCHSRKSGNPDRLMEHK